jgi:aryl sulfotransferase
LAPNRAVRGVAVSDRVWLASYPKSGNTWMRLLIGSLSLKDGEAVDINKTAGNSGIASGRGPFESMTLIDSGLLTHDEIDRLRPRVYEALTRAAQEEPQNELQTPPPVRFIKAHDAYTLTSLGEPLLAGARGAKSAIVIVRDPRDVAPSLANHDRTTIDKAISLMNDFDGIYAGRTDRQPAQFRQKLLDWSGHVASWLDQQDIPVHLVRYEDLKRDTVGTLLAAMRFVGFPVTPGAAVRAVSLTAFGDLRDQERELGFGEAPRNGNVFFRRGEAGAWRDELTVEQVVSIESAHGMTMARLGYELSTGPRTVRPKGVIAPAVNHMGDP